MNLVDILWSNVTRLNLKCNQNIENDFCGYFGQAYINPGCSDGNTDTQYEKLAICMEDYMATRVGLMLSKMGLKLKFGERAFLNAVYLADVC